MGKYEFFFYGIFWGVCVGFVEIYMLIYINDKEIDNCVFFCGDY